MSTIKQSVISGVKWSAIQNVSVQGIHFLLGLLLARLLSPSDFGTVGMIGIFLAISSTFIDSGFSNALIRKKNCTNVDLSTVFYFNICISLFFYVILFLIAPWVASFFNIPILCPILRVQSIALIINSLMGVQNAKLTIDLDFKGLAKRTMFSSVISGVCGVIMAYIGLGVWALVFQGLIAALLNLFFLWFYLHWKPLWTFSISSFKEMGSYGSKLLASGLLNTIYEHLTPLAIGKFYTPQDLGYYNRGTSFANYPMMSVNGIIKKVSFPILAKIQDDDERLVSIYRKWICIASMCIMFGTLMLAAIGKPLILLLLTSKWSDAIIYLQVYCFSAMFQHINGLNLNLLQVKGRSDLFLKLEIIKKIISTLFLFCAIPFGVMAICISRVINTQVAIFINTYYTGKLLGIGYVEQVKDYSVYFFLSLVACTPAYLFTLINIHPILSIIIGCSISISLYYLLLRKNQYMLELLDVLKTEFAKKASFRK